MIKRLLIANRGEIAVRIIRTCRMMNITTIAIYSEADKNSLHVQLADEAICIGPNQSAESYLDIDRILEACNMSKADAIHPGYGFLSESTTFRQRVDEENIIFVGPSFKTMDLMGDKIKARETMYQANVPIIPGSIGEVKTVEEAREIAEKVGFPFVIKAASGGGGKGIRIVHEASELEKNFKEAQSEGEKYFGDKRVYIETFIDKARHVEVQVLGSRHGEAIHLGERDCSIQRKNQKLIEEAPCTALDSKTRASLHADAVKAAKACNYESAGTIEFLLTDNGYYFLEMNTRIQVEHTVTELLTGVDLIKQQILMANGEHLSLKQEDIKFEGHVIECRINAENPEKQFRPAAGKVLALHLPNGFNTRVDSMLYDGYMIPPYYDSLVAKILVKGTDRLEAIEKMKGTLEETVIDGFPTTLDFLYRVLSYEPYINNDITIKFLHEHKIV
ncbi:acetyl-CoA carboxylase biotin carboxylase subunit [Mammaliicoccus vitulinus]|uniref:acetyl-CoA carboxylase biotin carboxylase subunit n=1 Tax=Mammaliicoccus vitulinus TaxID=71237 RepID=UPI000D1D1B1E|nr:acetyl-CoA carboxylase biotin carboxylase subunit [Mammaliicoccus vitulinus]PTI89330.1 acetyl-CoA carboxylase biotin carboxylase subunit [Mammaliicoccus vitulinus]QQT16402.1 acetyl-CoA carboxylase biotin carboxylase subunit [Mammaliicoccus vitulinus]QQY20602.1 acetyl-CoA carboxylase biotin carboxylase subunit [Mammaliicoccus vitulinus]RIN16652.1 acetyl-CoA carboxylase biotin carboxylase subunit [Mammaliicoccus vitulinus]RTX91623.1 acetyl-CoA carboxylase biotin carboxylase subunit [Mammaliic